MEVAVTLSLGGNQAADTSGGAEQKMIPGEYIFEGEEIMPGIEKYMLEEGECQRGVMHSAWLFCIALTF